MSMSILINALDNLTDIGLIIAMSLYLRIILQFMGQTWVKTISHTATLLLLPIVTYVITSVISGNIALSLGMVGALSIVRFRNPVRSPLELSIYFGVITIGISASVRIEWALLLVLSFTFVALLLLIIQKITLKFSLNPFFISSFSEGNIMSTLHIVASSEIVEIDANENLTAKVLGNGEIVYTLAHSNFNVMKMLEQSLRENKAVVSIQLSK